MAIKFLEQQQRMRQLGEIRLGNKLPTKNGGSRPNKLANWRLTSPDRGLLEVAATQLGGTVREWADAPATTRSKWELLTESDELDVAIPPVHPGAPADSVFSQWMELWNGGGCVRRCDGQNDLIGGDPCQCPVGDVDAMRDGRADKKNPTCVMTTRLSLLVYRLPDLGVWKLETHGYYAAVELGPAVNALLMANQKGFPQPAKIRIEARTVQKQGEARKDFIVPVLSLPTMALGAALGIPAPRRQVLDATPAPVAAIESAPKTKGRLLSTSELPSATTTLAEKVDTARRDADAKAEAALARSVPAAGVEPKQTEVKPDVRGGGNLHPIDQAKIVEARREGAAAADAALERSLGGPAVEPTDPAVVEQLVAALQHVSADQKKALVRAQRESKRGLDVSSLLDAEWAQYVASLIGFSLVSEGGNGPEQTAEVIDPATGLRADAEVVYAEGEEPF
jgi:hypothetical protein